MVKQLPPKVSPTCQYRAPPHHKESKVALRAVGTEGPAAKTLRPEITVNPISEWWNYAKHGEYCYRNKW